ncbi:hypothetical protein B0T25DRAFT_243284 [Lasiosphaeria hispida]|uniref:Uncharacterized protein n=1 Tax=Lasiosphaeria hispida TaxID=260671 RepID=A0AAJ0HEM8_9PEZI|nr:hypothetical protein B0T25DRAFT_243284 [Lasiosphaeria hispida]
MNIEQNAWRSVVSVVCLFPNIHAQVSFLLSIGCKAVITQLLPARAAFGGGGYRDKRVERAEPGSFPALGQSSPSRLDVGCGAIMRSDEEDVRQDMKQAWAAPANKWGTDGHCATDLVTITRSMLQTCQWIGLKLASFVAMPLLCLKRSWLLEA